MHTLKFYFPLVGSLFLAGAIFLSVHAQQATAIIMDPLGSDYSPGEVVYLVWTVEDEDAQTINVDIDLYESTDTVAGQKILHIDTLQDTTLDGYYEWTIPEDFATSEDAQYLIRISRVDNPAIYDEEPITFASSTQEEDTTTLAVCPLNGSLQRDTSTGRVYAIYGCKKDWIHSPQDFVRRGYQWQQIMDVSPTQLNQLGRLKLIRATGDEKVYYITEAGFKRWIPTAQVFTSYGNNWSDIVEVSPSVLGGFIEPMVIKLEGTYQVYRIENNQKRWIKTAAAFTRLGLDWTAVGLVNTTEFNAYAVGPDIE